MIPKVAPCRTSLIAALLLAELVSESLLLARASAKMKRTGDKKEKNPLGVSAIEFCFIFCCTNNRIFLAVSRAMQFSKAQDTSDDTPSEKKLCGKVHIDKVYNVGIPFI